MLLLQASSFVISFTAGFTHLRMSIGVRVGGAAAAPRAWKFSGQTLFSGQAQLAQKSWIIRNTYSVQWIQGTLCFSGQAQVAQKLWMVKKFSIQCISTWGDPQACPWECHSYGNPMGNVPWDEMGQHTFVFPMRLRNRMRVSGCYWIVILRLYFWILKSINFVVLHVSLHM